MSAPNVKPVNVGTPNVKANVNASKAASGFGAKMKEFFSDEKKPMIIIIVVVLLLFVIVVLYIMFQMRGSGLKLKKLLANPVKTDSLSQPITISSADIPKLIVGREYSFSFWTYMENFTQEDGNMGKLVWFRGSSDSIGSANPIVFLDPKANKLNFAIKTQGTSIQFESDAEKNLNNIISNNYFLSNATNPQNMNQYVVISVDYVPLQRWVHFVLVIDNKLVTVYLDGEIYSVKSTDEFRSLKPPQLDANGVKIETNLIIDKTDGDIFVGRSAGISKGATLEGYVSRVQFANFALSINDVKKIYKDGPVGGSGSLGFGYGVRSPLYKLDANVQ